MLTDQDSRYMQRALALAGSAVAQASPNPQVGCVLVRDGVTIGEGTHLYAARDHAEIAALKQADFAAVGATAYVTLEPCSHHGRTPPCADALIAAKIARCVVATLDPNPQVSGQGVAKLRAAGIEVEVGLLQAEARAMNDAFAAFDHRETPLGDPEGRALGRRPAGAPGLPAHPEPALLAHQCRLARRGPASPPQLRRHPHRHRHRPRGRPFAHRSHRPPAETSANARHPRLTAADPARREPCCVHCSTPTLTSGSFTERVPLSRRLNEWLSQRLACA